MGRRLFEMFYRWRLDDRVTLLFSSILVLMVCVCFFFSSFCRFQRRDEVRGDVIVLLKTPLLTSCTVFAGMCVFCFCVLSYCVLLLSID